MISLSVMIAVNIIVAGVSFLIGTILVLNNKLDCTEENKLLADDITVCADIIRKMYKDLPDDKKEKYFNDENNFEVKI